MGIKLSKAIAQNICKIMNAKFNKTRYDGYCVLIDEEGRREIGFDAGIYGTSDFSSTAGGDIIGVYSLYKIKKDENASFNGAKWGDLIPITELEHSASFYGIGSTYVFRRREETIKIWAGSNLPSKNSKLSIGEFKKIDRKFWNMIKERFLMEPNNAGCKSYCSILDDEEWELVKLIKDNSTSWEEYTSR